MRQQYYKKKQQIKTVSTVSLDNRAHRINMPNVRNRTYTDMTVCAQMHFNICEEIGVKLDNKYRYDHVPKISRNKS